MNVDYNILARHYAQHRHVHPGVLAALLECGHINATSRVLEVGCGTGNYAIPLQETAGCACWGIDPSVQMLARARKRSLKVQFNIGYAEKLAFPEATFNLVFSVDVIHHVSNRSEHYRAAYRVLKPGGMVCTVTDSEDIIRKRQPLSNYFPETVEVELQRYPSIADLEGMMAEAGFSRLENTIVEHCSPLTDIERYREKAFSSLHLIPQEAFERGIRRMEEKLRQGPIALVSRYYLLWGTK